MQPYTAACGLRGGPCYDTACVCSHIQAVCGLCLEYTHALPAAPSSAPPQHTGPVSSAPGPCGAMLVIVILSYLSILSVDDQTVAIYIYIYIYMYIHYHSDTRRITMIVIGMLVIGIQESKQPGGGGGGRGDSEG
jgi:hypothetical protein